MTDSDHTPFSYSPSDSVLDASLELIVSRRIILHNLTLSPTERLFFKYGVAVGMNETYNSFLHTKPTSPNNSISA